MDKDYWQVPRSDDVVLFAEDERVETNPPAMLTGVGLMSKSEPQSDTCDYQSGGGYDVVYDSIKHLVIRAQDIFKFDETTLKTCEGDHSSYYREEWDNTEEISCCGEFIYNATAQACVENEHGFEVPHFKGIKQFMHISSLI